MITTRPATRADFEAFYGKPPPYTLRGIVGESTLGEILGFAGFYIDQGVAKVFTDNHESMTKRDRIRGARAVMELIRGISVEVIAATPVDGVGTVMRHYGFAPWQGQSVWRLERDDDRRI